jgi:parallel beta-helix repeat protein
MKYTRKTVSIVLASLIIGILLGVMIVSAINPTQTFTLSSGIYPGAPSYTVWREGSYYFAKDAFGKLAPSSTVFATVMQYAIDHSLNGTIYLAKGVYLLTMALHVDHSNFRLEGETSGAFYASSPTSAYYGTEIRGNGAFGPLIEFRADDDSRLERLTISHVAFNGRATSYHAGWHNLYFYNCSEVWVTYCEIYQASAMGIEFDGSGELQWVMFNDITGNYGSGIETSTLTSISNNHMMGNQYAAIKVLCQNVKIDGNQILRNIRDGIWVQYSSNVMITNNEIYDNDYNDQNLFCGIVLEGPYSNNCTITGNKLLNNDKYDIWIKSGVSRTQIVGDNCNSYNQQGCGIKDDGTNTAISSCWNGTVWISSGGSICPDPESEASYIVFEDSGVYKAKNCSSGQIDYSSTNASYVINSALSSLTGGRIWKEKVLLKGTFDINTQLNVYDNTILEIDGRLELTASITYMIYAINEVNIEIRGGVLDGNGIGAIGIFFSNCYDCDIEGAEIRDFAEPAIDLYGSSGDGCYGNTIKDNYIYNCAGGAIDGAIYLRNCDNNSVTGNYVNKVNKVGPGIAVISTSYPTTQSEHNKVIGNTVINGGSSGYSVDDGITLNGDYNTASINHVYDSPASGIDLHGAHVVCVGNTVKNSSGQSGWGAIHLVDCTYSSVTGNTIEGGITGINIGTTDDDFTSTYDNTISGNNIYGCTNGIRGRINRATIIGNSFVNCTCGIEFTKTAAANTYSIVNSNYFYGGTYGLYERNLDYICYHDNVFRACTTAIDVTGTHHDAADNVIWS